MNKDGKIEGLRMVSAIHMIEATALSVLCLLVFIGAPSVFPTIINPYDPNSLKILQGVIILPVAYFLFALVGNIVRMVMISKLQKKSKGKKK